MKFHHTDGREVWGISPMCPDIGSACYSCLSTLPEGVSVFRLLRQSVWNICVIYSKKDVYSLDSIVAKYKGIEIKIRII